MGKIWGKYGGFSPPYSPIFSPYFPHIFYGGIDVLYWCTGVLVYWCTGVLVYWCTGVLVYWCTGVLVYCFCTLLTYPPLQHNIFDVSLTHEDYMVVSPYKKGKPADVLVWAERRVTL